MEVICLEFGSIHGLEKERFALKFRHRRMFAESLLVRDVEFIQNLSSAHSDFLVILSCRRQASGDLWSETKNLLKEMRCFTSFNMTSVYVFSF